MKESRNKFYQKSSELFESEVYLEEVSDVLCIAQAGGLTPSLGRTRILVRTGVVVSDLGKPSYPVQGNVLWLITILL